MKTKRIPAWCEPGGSLDLGVKGRGRFSARATPEEGRVTVRIDDDRNPEFWCEVALTEAELVHLLEQVAR